MFYYVFIDYIKLKKKKNSPNIIKENNEVLEIIHFSNLKATKQDFDGVR